MMNLKTETIQGTNQPASGLAFCRCDELSNKMRKLWDRPMVLEKKLYCFVPSNGDIADDLIWS